MGCFVSLYYKNIYNDRKELLQYRLSFATLQLTEADIGSMYRMFRKIDMDGSGNIEIAEMLAFLDVDRTKFSKRLFSIFDDDASGEIDFKEFVLSCWNYCSLCKSSLIVFAFDLYDKDDSGIIDAAEVILMTKDVYGRNIDSNPYTKGIMHRLSVMEDPELTISDFKDFVKQYPALLFPAYLVQEKIRVGILGTDFWKDLADRRLKLSGNKYISVSAFLAKHTAKDKPDGHCSTTTDLMRISGTVASRQGTREDASPDDPRKSSLASNADRAQLYKVSSFAKSKADDSTPSISSAQSNSFSKLPHSNSFNKLPSSNSYSKLPIGNRGSSKTKVTPSTAKHTSSGLSNPIDDNIPTDESDKPKPKVRNARFRNAANKVIKNTKAPKG